MSFTEFLWKLLATALVIGIIGIVVATYAEQGSTLQGYTHLVVGSCTLVTILAVILQIWQYKPRSRRHCGNMPQ
jgi:Na+/serine symporter